MVRDRPSQRYSLWLVVNRFHRHCSVCQCMLAVFQVSDITVVNCVMALSITVLVVVDGRLDSWLFVIVIYEFPTLVQPMDMIATRTEIPNFMSDYLNHLRHAAALTLANQIFTS